MNEICESTIIEIISLHEQIQGNLKQSLEDAMRIGELLYKQKEAVGHGNFLNWIGANLPFGDRTARNYMRLHKGRDVLKTESVSVLGEAYKLLTSKDSEDSGVDYDKIELDIYQQCGFSDLDGPSREIAALSPKTSEDLIAIISCTKNRQF